MQCSRCRHENSDGAKFCGECGTRLELACPACATLNPPANKFCQQCGGTTGGGADARFASPEAYTPKHLAEQDPHLARPRWRASASRSPCSSPTSRARWSCWPTAIPRRRASSLDPVLERMMEAVHRYEGTVNQVMGDGIMALFGAPLAHEDHAVRACYAALRMQESRRAVRRGAAARAGRSTCRSASASTPARSSCARSAATCDMDYTAVGQTTHLAARMEQLAAPGHHPDHRGHPAAGRGLRRGRAARPGAGQGPRRAGRGLRADAVRAGPPRASRPRAARAHAASSAATPSWSRSAARSSSAARGHGPGRGARRRAGGGQVAAGVGVHALAADAGLARARGPARSPTARPRRTSRSSTCCKRYFQIEAGDDAARDPREGHRQLLDARPGAAAGAAALLALLDVPGRGRRVGRRSIPPQRRQRTLDAVKRLSCARASASRCWWSSRTCTGSTPRPRRCSTAWSRACRRRALLLLANYRPEYQHAWGSKTVLHAAPARSAAARERGRAARGAARRRPRSSQPLKQLLIERTEGNPLFLEESVRTLVETEVLVGERGAYRWRKPLASIQVPATVQAVLAARIDRLPPEDKRLLQAAAVIGKDVPVALLQAVADVPATRCSARLELLEAEFLYDREPLSRSGVHFKHALTHDVAYASLLQDRRRRSTRRIVEAHRAALPRAGWPSTSSASPTTRSAASCGTSGGLPARGGRAKARRRSAQPGSGAFLEQALAALGHLPGARHLRPGHRPAARPPTAAAAARPARGAPRALRGSRAMAEQSRDDQSARPAPTPT